MTHTLLLVRSHHLGWTGLRTTLRARREFQILGEARQMQQALSLAQKLAPEAILVASDLPCTGLHTAIEQLRSCCPTSKILLLGDLLSPAEQVAFLPFDLAAYLLWPHLSPDSVPRILINVLEDDLYVANPPVVRQLQDFMATPPGPNVAAKISPREAVVLRGLAAGWTHAQIAVQLHMTERTVRRIVWSLEERFEAPSAFMLGMRTAIMGFNLPDVEDLNQQRK